MALEDFLKAQTGEDVTVNTENEPEMVAENVDVPEVTDTPDAPVVEATEDAPENQEDTPVVESTEKSFEEMWAEKMGDKYGDLEGFDNKKGTRISILKSLEID
jgi:hypothetical protein